MTIRAIIGTVAVLAGFAVIERSVDASTGQAGSCKAMQANATLLPGDSIVVRAAPTPEAEMVGMLSGESKDEPASVVVTMTSSASGWARIALDPATPHSYGWVPADTLSVDTRIDGTITTYSRPGLMGSVTGKVESGDVHFRVLGCRGELLQVINASQGNIWIDRWCARAEGCRG